MTQHLADERIGLVAGKRAGDKHPGEKLARNSPMGRAGDDIGIERIAGIQNGNLMSARKRRQEKVLGERTYARRSGKDKKPSPAQVK